MFNIKTELIYNYSFNKPIVKKEKDGYSIHENGKKYKLYEINDEKYFKQIYELIEKSHNDLKNRYKIIRTKNNSTWITYKQKKYFMIEKKDINEVELKQILNRNIFVENKGKTYQNNWKELWSNKIDYIEKICSIEKKADKRIYELLDYALLMTETAIMYISNEKSSNKLVISYRKIDIVSMENPLNIIIDTIERNISNELKLNYIMEKDIIRRKSKIKKILLKNEKLNISYNKVMARLLYPEMIYSFVSNIRKQNKKCSNKEISELKKQIESYEKYLSNIYVEIKKRRIKNVDWL